MKTDGEGEQVEKLSQYFKITNEEFLIEWLSDNLVYHLKDEEFASKALIAAEEKVEYLSIRKIDRKKLIKELKKQLKLLPQLKKHGYMVHSHAKMMAQKVT